MSNRLTVWISNEDGEREVAIPTRWEVCPYCDGEGQSSAYLGAFTASEMYEMGDEFHEDYMRGNYDKICPECDGRTTVPVVDEDRCSPELLAAYEQQQQWEWEARAEREAERRAGC